ncbi:MULTISPECIES: hypothetical protein [Methanobacterium]|uniref:Uncharacterized protein n=1 Tax=Methanobacterium veterum TaxID=408577 RepID=A0A9E4ZYH9_9EURY|nr:MULTISPECIES: hypothetical protein [Methanobacterium]MCZ3366662.1 hypothetical protein [Methanobacterium veterum]MCZ3374193.1 hypothetical protein [Methanobacterium veterum]
MNFLEDLMNNEIELNVYLNNHIVHKNVVIKGLIEMKENYIIKLENSEEGKQKYGEHTFIINSLNIDRISVLHENGEVL